MSEDTQLWCWSLTLLPSRTTELEEVCGTTSFGYWTQYKKGLWPWREEKPKDELPVYPSFLPGFTFQSATKERNQRAAARAKATKRVYVSCVAGCSSGRGTEDEEASQGRAQKSAESFPWVFGLSTKLKWYRACPGLVGVGRLRDKWRFQKVPGVGRYQSSKQPE